MLLSTSPIVRTSCRCDPRTKETFDPGPPDSIVNDQSLSKEHNYCHLCIFSFGGLDGKGSVKLASNYRSFSLFVEKDGLREGKSFEKGALPDRLNITIE